jgi:hypothetical protein
MCPWQYLFLIVCESYDLPKSGFLPFLERRFLILSNASPKDWEFLLKILTERMQNVGTLVPEMLTENAMKSTICKEKIILSHIGILQS